MGHTPVSVSVWWAQRRRAFDGRRRRGSRSVRTGEAGREDSRRPGWRGGRERGGSWDFCGGAGRQAHVGQTASQPERKENRVVIYSTTPCR